MKYSSEEFHKAGLWFLFFALIASAPWLLAIPGILINISLYFSGDPTVKGLDIIWTIAFIIGPLCVSYIVGGFLGKSIINQQHLSVWACRKRGFLVAASALLTFIIINFINISLHDYGNSTETSAVRSISFVLTICAFVAPIALIIGAWAGGMLKTFAKKRANGV